jgi:hypothetical protein
MELVSRWMDIIKIDLRETGFGNRDWNVQAEDRDQWRALENTEMSIRVA